MMQDNNQEKEKELTNDEPAVDGGETTDVATVADNPQNEEPPAENTAEESKPADSEEVKGGVDECEKEVVAEDGESHEIPKESGMRKIKKSRYVIHAL